MLQTVLKVLKPEGAEAINTYLDNWLAGMVGLLGRGVHKSKT